MRWLRSLSNRIFVASVLLAVGCLGATLWLINRTLTAQAERAIARDLMESATLVTEYRRVTLVQLAQAAHLLADLPKLKAAVALDDPPTLSPLAADYRRQLGADVLLVTGRTGRVLAEEGFGPGEVARLPASGGLRWAAGRARVSFLPRPDGVLLLATVPIWIDPAAPDLLGTLSVGRSMDAAFAAQIERLTDSEVTFVWDGVVRASTLPHDAAAALAATPPGPPDVPAGPVGVGDDQFSLVRRPLDAEPGAAATDTPATDPWPGGVGGTGEVVVARSRAEQLATLRALHTALGVIALVAVVAATALSYLVSRSITGPLRAITARMRQMAASGDLDAPGAPNAPDAGGGWDDEDARVLASSFDAMTASLARFQREAAQRERLSTLGRLSTVVAHEIRNPLMIIRAALRSLRRPDTPPAEVSAAVADIGEEAARLNRLVEHVLDFARPIRVDPAPARLSEICAEAVRASESDGLPVESALRLDPAADAVVTDAERLRQALINVLANARQATVTATPGGAVPPPVVLETQAIDGDRVRLAVRDRGPGLDAATRARLFEPFFTTKPSGTGIGLAITRNIVEGLGGTISVASAVGDGTTMVIDLPRRVAAPTPPAP